VQVGIRELKAHLSAHLDRVKAGQTVVVTERGRAVAMLVPFERRALPPAVECLLETGVAAWSGRDLPPFEPLPLAPGDQTLAAMVSEDRR
jgi:prevent-host-death family protein